MWPHLVKQGDVQREAEAISQVDLVCQSVAELAGCGGGVRQERLRGAVHKRHRKHDGLLRFSGLEAKKIRLKFSDSNVPFNQFNSRLFMNK